MAQKHQDSEGEPQPSPVPEDIARESEAPSEGDGEHGQSDYDSDAPGSQNVPAAGWLLLEYGVVHRRILTGRRREAERPRRLPAEHFSAELVACELMARRTDTRGGDELSGTAQTRAGCWNGRPGDSGSPGRAPGYRLGSTCCASRPMTS